MVNDKAFVGTVPSGLKFLAVERDGRRMPVLNGKGEVDFWDLRKPVTAAFSRAIEAMDNPERLKVVGHGEG